MGRILIAEDDAHVLRVMSMWLTRSGHEVAEASNGLEAQEQLEEGGIDLLVTDINMPGCDGVRLVEWLREELGCGIPVIIISARCDQAKIGAKMSALSAAVHPKPFSPSRLSAEIDGLLSSAAANS